MADYTNFGNENSQSTKVKRVLSTKAVNLGRVFGYMALAILATAVFTGLFGYLIWTVCECVKTPTGIYANYDAYLGFAIGAIVPAIGMIVCSILAGAFSFKHRQSSRSVLIPFAIYAICVGYVLALIIPFIPFEVLAVSLGASLVVFGSLALVGLVSKGNMNPLMTLAGGLMSGIFLICLMNLIFIWFVPSVVVDVFFWIISLGIFVVLMLTTIWDVWHIKTIAEQNELTPNLTLFLAFRLYVDFIAIFIRILYYVLIIYSRHSN